MFRLRRLYISRHKILGNIDLTFCNRSEGMLSNDNEDIFTSVIIGVNGIGKSHLMRAVADIFCYINDRKDGCENPRVPQFYFDIEYYYGRDNLFRITNINENEERRPRQIVYTGFYCWLNQLTYNSTEIDVPKKVIASTMTVSDKFLAKSDSHYIYKGIRSEQTPSSTGTRTMIRKTVSSLMRSLELKVGFTDEIRLLLKELGFLPKLHLSYSFRYRNVFLGREMTPELFCDIFDSKTEDFKSRQTKMWGVSYFQKIRNDRVKLFQICDFLNTIRREYGNKRVLIEYDVLDESQRLTRESSVLEMLSSLDLLSFPSLRVYKDNQDFDFEQSSSVETHLLCQMIGIMSDIEDNCLVLIDEPENSSHPNWQMKYIDWLMQIFQKYHSTHFVIATHSHFLLTNLRPDKSSVVALDKQNGELVQIEKDVPYCWSVDDILYRVFHVRNVRNAAFEDTIYHLYDLMERKDENQDAIRETMAELEQYKIGERDPLNRILNKAKQCLS